MVVPATYIPHPSETLVDRLSAPQANRPTETWQMPVLVPLSNVDDSDKSWDSAEYISQAYDRPFGPS